MRNPWNELVSRLLLVDGRFIALAHSKHKHFVKYSFGFISKNMFLIETCQQKKIILKVQYFKDFYEDLCIEYCSNMYRNIIQ